MEEENSKNYPKNINNSRFEEEHSNKTFDYETDSKGSRRNLKSRNSEFFLDFDQEMKIGLELLNKKTQNNLTTAQKGLFSEVDSPSAEKILPSSSKFDFSLYKSEKNSQNPSVRSYAVSHEVPKSGLKVFDSGKENKFDEVSGTKSEKVGRFTEPNFEKKKDKFASIVGATTTEKKENALIESEFYVLDSQFKSKSPLSSKKIQKILKIF